MTSKRLYYLLIGLMALLFIGLIAGTYGISSLLASQATSLTNFKAKSTALNQEQLGLSQAKADVRKYASLEQIAQAIVPEDKDQAEAVREIVNIAGQYNVSLASITFPASTLGTATSPSTSKSTSTSSSAASSSNASSLVSSPSSPLNALSQLEPVTNIPGVYDLTITVQSDPNHPVAYAPFVNFLTALEHNRRTAQVSSIDIEPSTTKAGLLSFTLTLNEYIKP